MRCQLIEMGLTLKCVVADKELLLDVDHRALILVLDLRPDKPTNLKDEIVVALRI